MIENLGSALDRFQNLLGKAFVLAGIVPVLLLAGALAGLFYAYVPGGRYALQAMVDMPTTKQLQLGVVILFVVAVVAFVFWSLNSWIRQQWLEGNGYPDWLRQPLVARQQAALDELNRRIREKLEEVAQFRRAMTPPSLPGSLRRTWRDQLVSARQAGNQIRPPVADIANLQADYDEIERLERSAEAVPFSTMQSFFDALMASLSAMPADRIEDLDLIHESFGRLSQYARTVAEARWSLLQTERDFRFPTGSVRPSSFGNVAQLPREYAWTRYRIDLEVFLPTLQKAISADTSLNTRLEEAKIKLDFGVAMTATAALAGLGGFLIGPLPQFGPTLEGVLALVISPSVISAVLGVLATSLFYRVSLQNYHGYAQLLRSAVDLCRFDLLAHLHHALPSDSKEEQDLWNRLTLKATNPEVPTVLKYLHATSPVPPSSPPPTTFRSFE